MENKERAKQIYLLEKKKGRKFFKHDVIDIYQKEFGLSSLAAGILACQIETSLKPKKKGVYE